MPLPLVSILIPTYRQAAVLPEAVASALAQDYPNLEVVVCDDASPEDVFKALPEPLSPRLRLYRNPSNVGRVNNYRRLLYDLAKGDWVLMLDGDDVLTDPTFIGTAMDGVARDSRIVCVSAGYCVSDVTKMTRILPVSQDITFPGTDVFYGWEKRQLPHLGCVYKRDLACSINFYREDIESSDYESLLRLFLHGHVRVLARTVGIWRRHGANTSQSHDYTQFRRNRRAYENAASYAILRGLEPASVLRWKKRQLERQTLSFLFQNIRTRHSKNDKTSQAIANLAKLRGDTSVRDFTKPAYAAIWLTFTLAGSSPLNAGYRLFMWGRGLLARPGRRD